MCVRVLVSADVLRAVSSGVKGGDDYRGPRLKGAPWRSQQTGRGQPKKMLRTVDGPLLRVVMTAYNLHVFFSLANLNIQKSLKHSNNWVLARHVRCTRRETRLTDSKTEPSSTSHPPAPERTNTNHSLNSQKEKDVKEPNSAPARGVLCAQGTRRDSVSKPLNTEYASSCSCTEKYIQNYVKIPVLESILKKTVGFNNN